MTWIDSHVHVWTVDVESYPLAKGISGNEMRPRHFTPEVFLRYSRPSLVSRVVLIQTINYNFDNSYMLDMVERFPTMFRLVAILDHEETGIDARMRSLLRQGVTGFRIFQSKRQGYQWFNHPGYDLMFQTASQTGQAICTSINPDGIEEVGRMCKSHPNTNVVIEHMARIGELSEVSDKEIDSLCALSSNPRVNIKISGLYSLGAKQPPHDDLVDMIKQIVDAFGAGRVMWGSDSPHQVVEETYEDSIGLIRDRLNFLTDDDRRQILCGTAERLFFIHEP